MKIALLATSGAGKTTYFTGLYGLLTQELNNSGYGIDFKIPDRLMDSNLDKRYTKLVDDLEPGEATKDLTAYKFAMSTQGSNGAIHQLDVEILDFPGEMLHQASQETLQKSNKIIETLAECDGFIVLLDGEAFLKGVQRQDPRVTHNKVKAHAVQKVLMKAIEKQLQQTPMKIDDKLDDRVYGVGNIPVTFALTKGDKIQNWLADEPEKARDGIAKSVQKFFEFNAAAAKTPHEDEGIIANFIRSQFGQIIDHPKVTSLRTAVSVFNEEEKRVDPYNVDHLLQFIIFQLLLNAESEYARRADVWDTTYYNNNLDLETKKKLQDEARQAFGSYPYDKRYSPEWFRLEKARDEAQSACSRAEKDRNHSLSWSQLAHKKSEENSLFLERILPDVLIYQLAQGHPKTRMYQKGLPLENIYAQKAWWRRRLEAGKKAFESTRPQQQLQLEQT